MKLTIKGLTKNYGKVCALSQFTYEFAPGIYGIWGQMVLEKAHFSGF